MDGTAKMRRIMAGMAVHMISSKGLWEKVWGVRPFCFLYRMRIKNKRAPTNRTMMAMR